jgi:predicted transcriptional regulator
LAIVKRFNGSAQKVRRAQILLKADANVSNWTDSRIAESLGCRKQTVENLRRRLVTEGFVTMGTVNQAANTPKTLHFRQMPFVWRFLGLRGC